MAYLAESNSATLLGELYYMDQDYQKGHLETETFQRLGQAEIEAPL